MSGTITGPDGGRRCGWCGESEEMRVYHDTEWGFPVADDRVLFEKICLEGFQSGLSWRTILSKRQNFRRAFHDFEIDRVAALRGRDVARLLKDPGIIRHRGKIEAAINNAARARELIDREGSLAAFVWGFEPARKHRPQTMTTSPESTALAKELKQRGWKFVGPTTAFAFMQAMGLVNDHLKSCVVRSKVEAARSRFRPPGA